MPFQCSQASSLPAALGLALITLAIGGADAAGAKKTSAAAPTLSEAEINNARDLFQVWSCGDCHALADAGATGPIGPAFDNNPNLTFAYTVDRITNGSGAMPPFGGQLSETEIAELSAYIILVAEN